MNETDFDIGCNFIESKMYLLKIVLKISNYNAIQKPFKNYF